MTKADMQQFYTEALAAIRAGFFAASPMDQIDPVLTEDGKSILLYGYKGDACFYQGFDLPIAITEASLDRNAWRAVALPGAWVQA